jgi:hypothetical protein
MHLYSKRQCVLNYTELGCHLGQQDHLELPFSDEEVKAVIMLAPKEKAPRLDGFIGQFFATCWEIIKEDILRAVQQFYMMNQQGLQLLNQANVVLIPKKSNPMRITEYRPISLTHSFVKIISKILANRLGLELHQLISVNQIAFIKIRCIHDTFVFMQQVIKDLHKKKIPSLFIKLSLRHLTQLTGYTSWIPCHT